MTQNFAFVSCDIIGHSAEPDLGLQIERISGINEIIDQSLSERGSRSVIWASGGDGGHVAFANPGETQAPLQLISRLRGWSRRAGVRLRIVANCGEAHQLEGAGGTIQLVGPGINLAGRLLEHGDQDRVVVTKQFAEMVEVTQAPGAVFSGARSLVVKYFAPQEAVLLSIEGEFESRWNDQALDDSCLLEVSVRDQRSWDVIYHSRRLMELDGHDHDAIEALLTLAEGGLTYEDGVSGEARQNPLLGPMDTYSRVDFIRSAQLVERDKGEILCRYQDNGDTMFVILRGEIAVLPSDTARQLRGLQDALPHIRIGKGAIVGELAFALRRKRTATLQCCARTTLLSFSPQAVEMISDKSPAGATIRKAMDRFVKLRILEHLCNNTSYLVGRTRQGPLKNIREPWTLLAEKTTIIQFSAVNEQPISRQEREFRGRGLYILVSGEARSRSHPNRRLFGTDLPIVFADFAGDLQSDPESYDVILDATIVRIAPEAFVNTFIPAPAFKSVLQAIRLSNSEGRSVNMADNVGQPLQDERKSKLKILFLAANPVATNQLQLDREAREIEEKLRGTKERDKIELVTKWALRADDLQQYLLEHQPHIVHFSGHGSDSNELILEDKAGNPKPLGQAALLALFRTLKDNIRVVVLNACFSEEQAVAITEIIDCAIGMNKAIGDQAAIAFATSLYRGLGFGRSVKTAFDLGRASLLAEGIPEDTTPVLLANASVDVSRLVLI
jgi:CRP-like cAMP-binding protein